MKKYYLPVLLALLLLSIAPLSEAQDHYGPIRRGQDLWDIAAQVAYQHYQDANVSHTQVMLALLAANPEAFTAPCNANSPLRVGVVLNIPTAAQVLALNKEQAQQQFDRQLQQWLDSFSLAGPTRVSRGIKLTGITCGSGALAAITGRCTRGATGLIAARAPLPQCRAIRTAEWAAALYDLL